MKLIHRAHRHMPGGPRLSLCTKQRPEGQDEVASRWKFVTCPTCRNMVPPNTVSKWTWEGRCIEGLGGRP